MSVRRSRHGTVMMGCQAVSPLIPAAASAAFTLLHDHMITRRAATQTHLCPCHYQHYRYAQLYRWRTGEDKRSSVMPWPLLRLPRAW